MNSTHCTPKTSNIGAKRIRNDLSQNRKLPCKTFSLSQFRYPFHWLISAISLNPSGRHIPRLLKFESKCLNIITRNFEFNNDSRFHKTTYMCRKKVCKELSSSIYRRVYHTLLLTADSTFCHLSGDQCEFLLKNEDVQLAL